MTCACGRPNRTWPNSCGAPARWGASSGVLLFQLPPFLKKDLPRLREFLALLPSGTRAAFEFRHALLAGRRGVRDAARPRRDPLRHRHRRRRHAVRRDVGLGLPAPATDPLRRPGVARLGGAHRARPTCRRPTSISCTKTRRWERGSRDASTSCGRHAQSRVKLGPALRRRGRLSNDQRGL